MPSKIRKMQLNEAFDSINEAGEIRLLEIAQMLAERYPKLIPLPEDESANDENARTVQSWAQSMVRPSMLM